MKGFIFVALILLLLISGCVDQSQPQDITPIVRALPQVQQFLREYPNAEISAALWSAEAINNNISSIRAECGQQMEVRSYWRAEISEENLKLIVWLNPDTQQPVCAKLKSNGNSVPDSGENDVPASTVVCTSSNPQKLRVISSTITPIKQEIELQNATGGIITIKWRTVDGTTFESVSLEPPLYEQIESGGIIAGGSFKLLPYCPSCTANATISGEIEINYADQVGFERKAKIVCEGTVPKATKTGCISSRPDRLIVKSVQITSTNKNIVLQNGTGGNITIEGASVDGSNFIGGTINSSTLANPLDNPITVLAGTTITIKPNCATNKCDIGNYLKNAQISFNYTDIFGYSGIKAAIKCEGPIKS